MSGREGKGVRPGGGSGEEGAWGCTTSKGFILDGEQRQAGEIEGEKNRGNNSVYAYEVTD